MNDNRNFCIYRNVGDQVHEEIVEKFYSIIKTITATNIDEILPQIKILDFKEDTLECLQHLFSLVEVNTELGRQYSEVCKEMYKVSSHEMMLKMHVVDLAKTTVLNYVEKLKNITDYVKSYNSSALGIADFLGGLYSTDILSTDFMIDIFEILTDSQKPCEAVLDFTNILLLTCGRDLYDRAGCTKMMVYTDWVEKQLYEIQAYALQESLNMKVKELSLLEYDMRTFFI